MCAISPWEAANYPYKETLPNPDAPGFNRHSQPVFDKKVMRRIAKMKIGVGGVGPLGMALVEQLMRLRPKTMDVIDNGTVGHIHLNRLTGAARVDAELNIPKVCIASRHVHNYDPHQKIAVLQGDFLESVYQEQFKECDAFFSTFNQPGARIAANQLCLVYGIALYDLTTAALFEKGRPKAVVGAVTKISPDSGFCLACAELFDKKRAALDLLGPQQVERDLQWKCEPSESDLSPQVYALNGMVVSWAVWMFLQSVAGIDLDFHSIQIDALRYATFKSSGPEKSLPYCPACGNRKVLRSKDHAALLGRKSEAAISFFRSLDSRKQWQSYGTVPEDSPESADGRTGEDSTNK